MNTVKVVFKNVVDLNQLIDQLNLGAEALDVKIKYIEVVPEN